MSLLWVDKYAPNNLEEYISHNNKLIEIDKWINNYINNKEDLKKILLLSGPPGIGKSTLANLILKKYNYKILEFNSSDIRSQKKIKEVLSKVLEYRNIIELIHENKQKIGLIMDEIDTLSFGGDRGGLTEFINLIKNNIEKKKLYNPIICTFNDFSDKKLNELKKYSLHIQLNKINNFELEKIINKISSNENFIVDDEAKVFLCKYSDGDIRRLINLLYDLYITNINNKNNNLITYDHVKNQQKTFMIKNKDSGIIEIINKIFNNKIEINDSIEYFENENYLMSNLVFENYLKFIYSSKSNNKTKLILANNIINNLTKGDIIYNYIFKNHDWSICYLSGLFNLSYTNYYINQRNKNNNEYIKIEYGPLFNKISIRNQNYKLLNNVKNKLNIKFDNNNKNLISFSKLINHYVIKEDIENLNKIIDNYQINFDDIDEIIKLNKLDNYDSKITFKKISAKLKKNLKKI